jgi:hypothetical protein
MMMFIERTGIVARFPLHVAELKPHLRTSLLNLDYDARVLTTRQCLHKHTGSIQMSF